MTPTMHKTRTTIVATIREMLTIILGLPTPKLLVAQSDIVLLPFFIRTPNSSGFFLKMYSKTFSLGTNSMLMILLYCSDNKITFDGTFTKYSRYTDMICKLLYKGQIPFIAPRAINCRINVKKKVDETAFLASFAEV